MAATIGDLLPEQQKQPLLLNGVAIPKRILDNHWDEFIDQIVFINHYEYEGVSIPYENGMGRLIEFKSDGRVRFQRKNGTKFEVHIDDVRDLIKFEKRE